jgi:hypothetical protein
VRQVALPRGVGRATLFALSVTLAGQACADTNSVAIYGAPVPPGAGASNGAGGTRNFVGIGGAGGSSGNGSAGQSNVQPVYGAVVPPQTGGSGGSAGSPEEGVEDAGSDAAGEDAG